MPPISKTLLFRWNKQSLMRTMRKMKRRKKELETISELVTGAEQSGVRTRWFTRFSIDTNFFTLFQREGYTYVQQNTKCQNFLRVIFRADQ